MNEGAGLSNILEEKEMKEVEFINEFINRYRDELPVIIDFSEYMDFIKNFLDDLTVDYISGNYSKWVINPQEYEMEGVVITQQDTIDLIKKMVVNKEKIIDASFLILQKIDEYDRRFGRPVSKKRLGSFELSNKRASFLMGYVTGAIVSLMHSNYADVSKGDSSINWKASIFDIISILLSVYFGVMPNSQLDELIDMQQEENAIIRKIDERLDETMNWIKDAFGSFQIDYEERTEAINRHAEALEENTEMLEQINTKMDLIEKSWISYQKADIEYSKKRENLDSQK